MLEEEIRSASARGNLQDVTSLLKRGAKVAPDSSGRTPLHLAAAGGHTEIVDTLVNSTNVNATDAVGRTALQIAATGGHVDVVKVLLKHGANVNSHDNLHGNTSLHEASWHGFSQTVSALVEYKANADIKNCAGFAPLHLCCQNGHNQSCRELLLGGADADIQNNYGDTALHTSARYGHAGVARILISANCRVSDQNKNGDTALHIAAAMGRRKLTTILLEAGCDKSIRNKQYETACDIATRKDLNEIIIILQSVKSQKGSKKKSKKTSDTSDSDKKSKENKRMDHDPGPVGVGLTCYCANFLRDMEARLEKNHVELKHKIKKTRYKLEERVERTEGILAEFLSEGRRFRSASLDLLRDCDVTPDLPTPDLSQIDDALHKKANKKKSHEELLESNSDRKHSHSQGSTPLPSCDTFDEKAIEKIRDLSLADIDIEKLPYRSRTAVYSPTFTGLSGQDEADNPPNIQALNYVPEVIDIKTLNKGIENESHNLKNPNVL
ncbi:unnamed protein product [Nezara viridula]|uniref:Ankyrin repeat domain-containing protein 6 n=1 Tax=Nezara viridula TaxID=85310 RepID=A0A9P0HQ48_NEZVI|nr:unnamed protein product [Nezara viridula]